MKLISNLIIPSITIFVIIHGLYKKIDIFNAFIKGVEEGLTTALNIFPSIMSMILAINLLVNSNLITKITDILGNILLKLSFPKEVLPISMLRLVSSSASLAYLDNIFKIYGPDSYIGILSSVIQGSNDTTIYILGMYFSSVGIKKTKYALAVGLLSDLICIIIAIIVVNIFI